MNQMNIIKAINHIGKNNKILNNIKDNKINQKN